MSKLTSLPRFPILGALLFLVAGVSAGFSADKEKGDPLAGYPLKVCVVSDEPLGSMGDAYRHVYKVAGQPDRVFLFCCEGCVDDFKKEPAKYVKKLDEAAKAAAGKKKGS